MITSVRDFFNSINLALLPEKAASYLQKEIIKSNDLDLIEKDEPVFVQLSDFLMKKYPSSLYEEVTLDNEPLPAFDLEEQDVLPAPSTKEELQDIINSYETLLEIEDDEKKIKRLQLKVKILKEEIAEMKEDGGEILLEKSVTDENMFENGGSLAYVRSDIIGEDEEAPVGDEFVGDNKGYEYKYDDKDNLLILHNGEWKEAVGTDWDFKKYSEIIIDILNKNRREENSYELIKNDLINTFNFTKGNFDEIRETIYSLFSKEQIIPQEYEKLIKILAELKEVGIIQLSDEKENHRAKLFTTSFGDEVLGFVSENNIVYYVAEDEITNSFIVCSGTLFEGIIVDGSEASSDNFYDKQIAVKLAEKMAFPHPYVGKKAIIVANIEDHQGYDGSELTIVDAQDDNYFILRSDDGLVFMASEEELNILN